MQQRGFTRILTNANTPAAGLTACKGGHFKDRILKIGMNVHSTNYTLCAVESRFGKEDHVLANIMELMKQIRPESSAVLIARYFEGKTYPEIGHEQFITER